ncbi:hypothetical protein GGR44_002733 [Sphingobium fontiphilum]|uniref:Putative auto-transporter adhesin head GIN domain-containing protein n=1 Tax=Sphingobium fontiphilum TaxID=944425 RepID=A0A7W6DNE1_9SPHN|nr:head GIN domain-containing protein [Sphingobium fontiphilum]MBB3983053.1 hypothetical protein [Sphingobium fontiphilum]
MPNRHFIRSFPLVALMLVVACSSGRETEEHGGAAPKNWSGLRDFDRIDLTGPDDVAVRQGRDFAVRAEGDPAAISQLEIRVVDGVLKIGREPRWNLGWSSDKGATIHVTMPAISGASLTGSGDLKVDRVDGKAMKAALTGSGNLTLGAVAVDLLQAELTGSGDIYAQGGAKSVEVSITGSGDFDGDALKAGGGKVEIMGSGNSRFASDGAVAISILGSGDANVKGKARCKADIMGSGEAHCAP